MQLLSYWLLSLTFKWRLQRNFSHSVQWQIARQKLSPSHTSQGVVVKSSSDISTSCPAVAVSSRVAFGRASKFCSSQLWLKTTVRAVDQFYRLYWYNVIYCWKYACTFVVRSYNKLLHKSVRHTNNNLHEQLKLIESTWTA